MASSVCKPMAQYLLVGSASELDVCVTLPVLHHWLSPATRRSNCAHDGGPLRGELVPSRGHRTRAYLGTDFAVFQAGKNLSVVSWVRILDLMFDCLIRSELILVGMAHPD